MAHEHGCRLFLVSLFLGAVAARSDCVAQTPDANAKPIVAPVWLKLGASGAKEVVITLDPEKLKTSGLTLEQVTSAAGGRRFVEGDWSIEIDEQRIDLATIAKLDVRDLHAPSFRVHLRDGRTLLITPDPKKIGEYVVPGYYFEEDVRRALAEFADGNPSDVNVFADIWVPGTVVPHVTERETRRHMSLGEPLKHFATVEVIK